MAKLLCRALAGSAGGVINENNAASLGNMYFVVLPRPVGYFTFIHSNKIFFTRIATSQYVKALPQSTPVVLWPSPLRFRSIAQIEDPGHWVVPQAPLLV